MPDIEDPPVETTPLIEKDVDDERKQPPPLKDMKAESIKEKLVGGAAVVGLTTSVAAMVFEHNPSVYVSGAIGAVVAPMAAMQQSKLTQVEALKQTNERLSDEVSVLQGNNVKLQTQVSKLETTVDHLEVMSTTLDSVLALEGSSLDELEKQLEESEKIYKGMKTNLRGDILQTIITVIMSIDKDGDMCLSDCEISNLIIEIEKILNDKIDFNDDLLRHKLISNGRSLNAVMDIIGDLLNDETEESIFTFVNKNEGQDDMASSIEIQK
mmetsp:Transcript_30749/g.35061  ORF Transcript_30749/g.35061 Transcript_30749/m.35061 type:complete len:268 (-) Transcript_30749:191-994(-)|eukprot:CAMPEP_0194158518 /NCGR_PEP_ID=MMETSP0152-20130528/76448_1 /TAXON_ID=1049557 /ORGANISM="Thalassiothrix antarctica, Strain L6-D1" /LENGTH=267 /DNA_ID=CAMNT_0038867817 /DNA_START=47 /DNA_END=850 /DNA_ORIENTATION=-